MVELKDLSLFVATREQTIESRNRSFAEWGRGYTLQQYLNNDEQLELLEHAADGRLTTWVLAPRNQPDTLDFMCACETYKRDALAATANNPDSLPASTATDHEPVRRCYGYGIASVFTPAEKRRKGYAKHMMRLLHWVLAPEEALPSDTFPPEWGQPPARPPNFGDALFSVLYSDVGENMYQSCGPTLGSSGWTVTNPLSTVFDVDTLPQYLSSTLMTAPFREMCWLFEEVASACWDSESKMMAKDLTAYIENQANTGRSPLCILPNKGTAAFLSRRAGLNPFTQKQYGVGPWGVRVSHGDLEFIYATWAPDPQNPPPPDPQTLVVTRIRFPREDLPTFLSSIHQFCLSLEVKPRKIEFWNLPKEWQTLAKTLGGETSERKEHLSSIKVYRPEDENWEWLFNERYAWC